MSPYKEIPLEQKYYTIGQVAEMFNVATSLLRHWETEFPIRPHGKYKNGNRRYDQSDIAEVKKVYDLVKVRGFTLQGAKDEMKHKLPEKERLVELAWLNGNIANRGDKFDLDATKLALLEKPLPPEVRDDYVKQEAVAFAEWIGNNGYYYYAYETDQWYKDSSLTETILYTTPELWDKWKQKTTKQ